MINLGNIENSNQMNQTSKSSEKLSVQNKIDAVQNTQKIKKQAKDKSGTRQHKKEPSDKPSKMSKQSSPQDKRELQDETYNKSGKKQGNSRLNLKA